MKVVRCVYLLLLILTLCLYMTQMVQAQQIDYRLLWSYETGHNAYRVSVSSDGSYIAVASIDDKVYFFNREGELLWSYEAGDGVVDVSISSNGYYVSAGSQDGKVYFFNREGDLLWNYWTGRTVQGVSMSSDGSYIAAMSDKVYFFNQEGDFLWKTYEARIGGSFSISSDGSYVAVGSGYPDEKVYLFDREGEILWNYEIGDAVVDVSLSSDGSYIAAGSRNAFYLFNREGELLWTTRGESHDYWTGGCVNDVPISSDGSYIATTWHKKVYLFNREEELLWDYDSGDWIQSISVSSDGAYISAASDNSVYLFNQKGELLWNYKTDDRILSVSISSDGSYIAVGSNDNKVYFFTSDVEILSKCSIEKANSAIKSVKSKGFNMVDVEASLSLAEGAFERANYKRAFELAEEVRAAAETISRYASESESTINVAESIISMESTKGFNVAEAEALLFQAERALNTGDYSKANELAAEAGALATDIDGDGIHNDDDLAPEINNNYIHVAAGILLVGSAVTLRTGLKRRKMLRLKHQRLEEDRQRGEKMKQETLDMIEEVIR